jgi:hypothetical protein
MTMKTVHGLTFALFGSIFVAACSGGGGGGTTPSLSNASSPSGGASSAPASAVSTQRMVSSSALSVADASVELNQLNMSNGSLGLALAQSAAEARRPADASPSPTPSSSPTCFNGVEYSRTISGSTIDLTLEFFYDNACTEPYMLRTLAITPPPASGGTGTATGTVEVFNESGTPVDFNTLALTFIVDAQGNLTQVSEEKTAAPGPSAAPYAQFGYACVYGTASAIDCGLGNAINDTSANVSVGFTETTTVASSPGPSASPAPSASPMPSWAPIAAPRSVQLQINGQGYTGTLGGLTLAPGVAPAWTVSGGTQAATLAGTASFGFGCGSYVSNVSLTLTDTAAGLTVTLTQSGHQLTGTVTNTSGQTVATISLDRSGSGTITYTNGTTAPVKDWIIVG